MPDDPMSGQPQIDPAILPHALRHYIAAMYANFYNRHCLKKGEARIDLDQAWESYGQHTYESAFGTAYPSGSNLSVEKAREAVAGDLEYWTEE